MKWILFLTCLLVTSCFNQLPNEPEFKKVIPYDFHLSNSAKLTMNGIYTVLDGRETFGDEVVGKWSNNRWCLYSKHDVVYSTSAGGIEGDTVKFNGYFRIVRSGSGFQLNMRILPNEGAFELIENNNPDKIILRGSTDDGTTITLQRARNLFKRESDFHILAHRGGGRNSERLGISENSIEMIKYADILGASGIEIDIKRTRDGQLIVFHDDTFSPRTVRGSYLLGNVENFDLKQIKLFGQLIYGEAIPTLQEALNAVIDSTELSLVWLDIKDPDIIDIVIPVQLEAINYAVSKGRELEILLGIPDADLLNKYRSSIYSNKVPELVELDYATALNLPSSAWAPRWTNGIPSETITDVMHNNDILVFTWTLDVQDYISDFINKSGIDGILSNYPSLVAGIYYSKKLQ